MRNIPVLHASGKTLAMAFENALVALDAGGARLKTQYDKPGDPESIDATMCITVDDPLADPMIHKAFPGGMADLREYVMELEGVKDSWTKVVSDPDDTRWEYTYHGRLARYGAYKDRVGDGAGEHNIYGCVNAHVDQFAAVVSKLARQPFTRQAQMITWVPSLDLECYDPPCLQRIWLRAAEEDGVLWLNFNVSFRSNDAWGAWMMNAFGITMMVDDLVAKPLAAAAGKEVRLGRLNWHADSWHVYGKDIAQFRARLIDRIPTTTFEDRTIMFWDPEVQEMYRECEPGLVEKIRIQTGKMAERDGRGSPAA
jgi:thymidylate synthase